MKTKLFTLIIYSFMNFPLFSQSLAEWGELREYEKNMITCHFDSTAEAVVLSDFEKIEVTGIEPLKIRHHKRIKILKEKAKDRANITIPYYHDEGVDKITYITAQTINIENGKIDKISLKKKDFFRIEVDEYRSEMRFTFPEVKQGSIIEYSYVLETKRYSHLKKWSFQSDIPTLFSQVTAHIDTRFRYRISYQGTRLQEKYSEGTFNTWLLTNLPRIKKEPFCLNEHDYIEQVNFQLESYITSLGTRDVVMKTWDAFAKDLLVESEFLKILNKENTGKLICAEIVDVEDSPIVKVKKIFNYVTSNYIWNEYFGIYPDVSLKQLLEEKSGSSPDLNTFLVLLMRSAGLEADPVLISTKRHGFISKSLPFRSQFNSLICNVHIDGKDILIDASRGSRPYNLLPKDDLNLYGFLVNKKNSRWVDLPVPKKSRTFKMVTMEMENPETIKYKYEISSREYDALEMRKGIHQSGLNKYFSDNLIRENAEISIDSISSKDLDNLEKPTFITTFITDKNLSVVNDDFVYLNPFVDYFDDNNLFNEKERFFPIDLFHPFENGYILNLTVPDGYEVVEYPESMNLKLPGDKGFLKFSSSLNNNKIQLRISISFKDYFFSPSEYPFLKEIYDLYIEKRQEQIVLKKRA